MSAVSECRFGFECRRVDCWFLHPQGRRIDDPTANAGISMVNMNAELPPGAAGVMMQPMYSIAMEPQLTTQLPQPKNNNCRYGRDCHRENCHFNHPDGRKVDELSNDNNDDIDDALDEFEADMVADSMAKLQVGGSNEEDFLCPCCDNNPYSCPNCAEVGFCSCVAGGVDDADDDSWRDEWFPESRGCECCNGYAYRCDHKLSECNDEKCACLPKSSVRSSATAASARSEAGETANAA